MYGDYCWEGAIFRLIIAPSELEKIRKKVLIIDEKPFPKHGCNGGKLYVMCFIPKGQEVKLFASIDCKLIYFNI